MCLSRAIHLNVESVLHTVARVQRKEGNLKLWESSSKEEVSLKTIAKAMSKYYRLAHIS